MGRGKKLSTEEIAKIVALKDHTSKSNREIAKIVSRSEKVVRNYLKNRNEYGQKSSGGRPSKLDAHQKRRLIRCASQSTKSAKCLRNDVGLQVSPRTVCRILNASKQLVYRKMKKRPQLSKQHIKNRKQFAISHMSWTKEWHKIIFSDEKKFNLDGPDGFAYYWHDLRKENRVFSTRQSGGGSVMVWAAIGYEKKGPIEFLSHRMRAVDYQNMVGPLFPAWGYEMAGKEWKFQQDNASIHVAKSTLAHFKERNINVFENWPAKSPDMNIIENVWGLLARKVYEGCRHYATKEGLIDGIKDAWRTLDQRTIQNLYHGLQRRIIALYDANGGHTKY